MSPAESLQSTRATGDRVHAPYWDTYDTINQLYLELGVKPEMRNHYRGHKMSLWLNLIPQLHRPGEGDDISMRHHHFQEEGAQYYDGMVRPQSMQKPTLVHGIGPAPAPTTFRPAPSSTSPTPPPPKSDTALQATTTECPPNSTTPASISARGTNGNNLLRKLASSHYQSYTTALTVTIAVGCFLLLLNILIFAGIYHQRDKGRHAFGNKKKEELAEAGSCSSSSGETYDTRKYDCKGSYELARVGSFECKSTNFGGEYTYEKRSLVEQPLSELPLQEFKSSPPSGVKRIEGQLVRPPGYSADGAEAVDDPKVTSPSIPEPPPPPKNQPPQGNNQTGILRSQTAPTTPGTMKKRVQIQEISV